MYILSIETATEQCSVALHTCEGKFVVQKNAVLPNAHSEQLGALIEELLRAQAIAPQKLAAIAISEGPGSYTGLRIGTSLAKGMCFALAIPLIAVNTLQALALSIQEKITRKLPENTVFVPMIDARRMEVYTAQWNAQNEEIQTSNALIVDEHSLSQFSSNYYYCIGGNGSAKCAELLRNAHIEYVPKVVNQAKTVGDIACNLFAQQQFVSTAYFEPLYLKEFQTTAKKLC
ncbi:MAG: tRNA (adenosine(37)-N6)-threonylcarbamoyltransferase complex dimerization subunit type 1 TsaB [Bacteroidales bacterium]|jgi:tRNA threonylcarbamoyladenosine biosynthesis protein TsaB|nr:tRNA (adenosine(37)-N6)-threonylcarbamoyltransferase complex dimerization subunit type 1 TsaB [Bacteroidales bacterium]